MKSRDVGAAGRGGRARPRQILPLNARRPPLVCAPRMKTQSQPPWSRRRFVQTLAAAATILAPRARAAAPTGSTRWRAAVIGHTGRGDSGHGLEAIFSDLPEVELVGLADPDAAGRAQTAARIGAPKQYADYRELLRQERPDLVSLAMRQADQHHAIALACVRAGAHLYCEKPFVTFPAEADEVLAEAHQRRRQIAVAHTMRLTPAVNRLQQALREGVLGELKELRAYGKQDKRAGGEDMMVLGSHLFDLFRLFAGDPLWCSARVLGQGRDIKPADGRSVADNVGPVAGDEVFAQFAFARGVNATFTSSEKLRETVGHWGIELHGSKGVARLNGDVAPTVFLRRTNGWKASPRTDEWSPLDPGAAASPAAHNRAPVRDWLEAIRREREPECSGRNGAWAVEMVCAVYQAALQGTRVAFPLQERRHPLKPG